MALGPLLKGRETRLTNRSSVTRFMLFEQAVADQKLNAALADLDRGNHGDAPGAALPEASGTDGGCRFMDHVTGCYYVINGDFMAISVRTFLFVGPQAIAARQTFRTI